MWTIVAGARHRQQEHAHALPLTVMLLMVGLTLGVGWGVDGGGWSWLVAGLLLAAPWPIVWIIGLYEEGADSPHER